jgi:hypothetical protein
MLDAVDDRNRSDVEVERTDDGYAFTWVDLYDGRELKAQAIPNDPKLVEKRLLEAGYDTHEAGIKIRLADRHFEARLTDEHRYFFRELKWRAKRGEATSGDVQALVSEIRREQPRFPHMRFLLIGILGDTFAIEHEELVAHNLYSWDRAADATIASRVLIQWGMLDKYETRFIELLLGVPSDQDGNVHYGLMSVIGEVIATTPRPRLAATMLDVALAAPIDTPTRTGGILHLARFCGADLEEAIRTAADNTKHADVIDRTRARLRELS